MTNEALLAGCYALVSNKAGSSSLVDEGVNGYTFSSMDVDELFDGMMKATKFATCYDENGLKKSQMIVPYELYMRTLLELLQN